jgi:hypothetical protein
MSDLMWSDPQPFPGREPSKRGVGMSFGPDVTERFLDHNGLDILVRSHEVKEDGYAVEHKGRCITVFSCVSSTRSTTRFFPSLTPPPPPLPLPARPTTATRWATKAPCAGWKRAAWQSPHFWSSRRCRIPPSAPCVVRPSARGGGGGPPPPQRAISRDDGAATIPSVVSLSPGIIRTRRTIRHDAVPGGRRALPVVCGVWDIDRHRSSSFV